VKKLTRHILVTAAVLFVLGSFVHVGMFGCLHHATWEFGLPVPWLAIRVQYGGVKQEPEHYQRGRVERIEGVSINWSMLPCSLAGTVLLSAIFIGLGRGVSATARALRAAGTRVRMELPDGRSWLCASCVRATDRRSSGTTPGWAPRHVPYSSRTRMTMLPWRE